MKKHHFLSAVLLLYLMFSFQTTHADVSKFSFITDPQSIGVNAPSDTITIQSQNSSGVSENITETTDIVFTSTSGTGQFLSTSGNAVSTTMSKNTANKNFIYKDSTPGTYTISITATGRTSLNTFTASQQINVGTTGNQNTNASTTEESVTPTPTPTPSTPPAIVNSAHSSPVPLSDTENKMEFEVSAGRPRLVMVGSQIFFTATPTRLQNIGERSISYEWSFGDGTTEKGLTVGHAYLFPGEYSVILNAYASDKQAVSRTTVKVVSPVFVINKVSEGVELINKSGFEVNLEGWNLIGGGKSFTFPKDTIIPSGNKVVFADSVTGIMESNVKIINPKGKLFGENIAVSTTTKKENLDLAVIQNKPSVLKSEVSKINSPVKNEVKIKSEKVAMVSNISTSSDQLANVIEVFKAPERHSSISRILSWPKRGIDFIKSLFVEQ